MKITLETSGEDVPSSIETVFTVLTVVELALVSVQVIMPQVKVQIPGPLKPHSKRVGKM